MTKSVAPNHCAVAVIGGGQAGLSMGCLLKQRGVEHVIFEKHRIAHTWRTQRWDSFCLVTPNWQCQLPGYDYQGTDPDGFMQRDEIVAYVEGFVRSAGVSVNEGVAVSRVSRDPGGRFLLETSDGSMTADAVVLAVSGYHVANIPPVSERIPRDVVQIHSSVYRNPSQLPDGAVLVIGSGQSGCQIAEDLHLAGRKVHLAVGSAPRCPRFYRGRDAVAWLSDLGQYELPLDRHPLKEKVRQKANHYLTGRDGGRDIDLRKFALEDMSLHGRLQDISSGRLRFANDLAKNLDFADASYNSICATIDKHIAESGIDAPSGSHYSPVWRPAGATSEIDPAKAGVSSVIWATGFRSDWSWVDLPAFDGSGYPVHRRGVTSVDGLYVLGLPWLYTWGSGRFVGVGRDAEFLADQIDARIAHGRTPPLDSSRAALSTAP